jgi:hypothetical protein
MKHLSKLVINPEKVMKNEELVNLRGGYDPSIPLGTGKCGFRSQDYMIIGCGVSPEGAKNAAEYLGGYWCCDTPTSYCESCGPS